MPSLTFIWSIKQSLSNIKFIFFIAINGGLNMVFCITAKLEFFN